MMPNLTFRPIDVWPEGWQDPKRRWTRVPSRFRASYDQTLHLLGEELDLMGYTQAHLQLAIETVEVRRDGQLRAHTRPTHPGVILTVVTPKATRVFRTDRFYAPWRDTQDWQANLRAIALGLVDLRRIDRYGLNEGDAQYAGFAALPPARPVGGSGEAMTVEQAARLLCDAAGKEPPTTPEGVRNAASMAQALFRAAAKSYHPDKGGDPATYRVLTEARDLLLREAVDG